MQETEQVNIEESDSDSEVEEQIVLVKSITFHPVLNGREPIDIPVSMDLSFKGGPTLRYDHDPKTSEVKKFEVEPFELNIRNASLVDGKLYALDRQRNSGYYFTLHPMMMPRCINPDIDIFVCIYGPCISWILSVTCAKNP